MGVNNVLNSDIRMINTEPFLSLILERDFMLLSGKTLLDMLKHQDFGLKWMIWVKHMICDAIKSYPDY